MIMNLSQMRKHPCSASKWGLTFAQWDYQQNCETWNSEMVRVGKFTSCSLTTTLDTQHIVLIAYLLYLALHGLLCCTSLFPRADLFYICSDCKIKLWWLTFRCTKLLRISIIRVNWQSVYNPDTWVISMLYSVSWVAYILHVFL